MSETKTVMPKCAECGRFCGSGSKQHRRYDWQGVPTEDYLLCSRCATDVEQLKWEHDPVTDRYCATSIVGVYYRWGGNWRLGNGMVFSADTPEAATKACQEDYERIVKSAVAA